MRADLRGFEEAYALQQARFPAAEPGWQPVHTVYVPADRFTAGTVAAWGDQASSLVRAHLAGPGELAEVFGLPGGPASGVHERVVRKLASEPVEDLRVDFEDGYGVRPDPVEDGHVEQAAEAVAALHAAGALPRRWGLRVKSFADGDPDRSVRTLDGFVKGVVARAGELPGGFVVTFPKVLMEAYLGQFAAVLARLEAGLGTRLGAPLRFEMQVEAPQTLHFLRGDLPQALDGRLAAAHFGVFDYTAALGLPPHEQRLDHPACDHARHVMQTAFAGTGVELSDGSLAASPVSDREEDVHTLWRRHAELVRHSLRHGYYQGWDMHPSHLVSRFATVYAYHLARYDSYRERVSAWEQRREAGGGVMDEPATIRTLAAALRRADLALP
ncbi:aldolase [Nonomuraea longispora]|uniref:Aldolase n=1 Tax=Nonomuraea longispora TaxID=1848320 RepID=A0A4R4N7D7_9ACTN|nr:aldolase [Nonomuraea longispora]TDC02807.1 aldolase [Nonomuraea longispora]